MSREDLTEQDKLDIEDLKQSLTDSSEFVDAAEKPKLLVRDLVELFNSRVRISETKSVPTSPSKSFKSNKPDLLVRNLSVEDFSSLVPFSKMTLEEELSPLRNIRKGHKGWVTRHLNSLKESYDRSELMLTQLGKTQGKIDALITKIEDVDQQIGEVYDKHKVDHEDSDRLADMDASVRLVFSA